MPAGSPLSGGRHTFDRLHSRPSGHPGSGVRYEQIFSQLAGTPAHTLPAWHPVETSGSLQASAGAPPPDGLHTPYFCTGSIGTHSWSAGQAPEVNGVHAA